MTTIDWEKQWKIDQKWCKDMEEEIKKTEDFAKENKITCKQATIVFKCQKFLNWTQEKEDYLIWLMQNKNPITIIDDDLLVPENYKNQSK